MSRNKNNAKTLIIGVLFILLFTVIYWAAAIYSYNLNMKSSYSYTALINVLTAVSDIAELFIYGAGIALMLSFLRVGQKKFVAISFVLSVFILICDYGFSFAFDYAEGNIDGYESLTLIYLLLNVVVRALLFAITLLFAGRIVKKSYGAPVLPIPFFSLNNPTSKMLLAALLVRSIPYLLFEIYANVTGIIEYGFDMTGSEVLAIISAYAEIVLAGAIIYVSAYLLSILLLHIHEKPRT